MSVRSRSHGAHETLSRGPRLFDAVIWKVSEPRPRAVGRWDANVLDARADQLSVRVLLDGVSDPANAPADGEQHQGRTARQLEHARPRRGLRRCSCARRWRHSRPGPTPFFFDGRNRWLPRALVAPGARRHCLIVCGSPVIHLLGTVPFSRRTPTPHPPSIRRLVLSPLSFATKVSRPSTRSGGTGKRQNAGRERYSSRA